MTDKQQRLSAAWPPNWRPSDPDSLDWRTSRLEVAADAHEDRITALESRPRLPDLESLPWPRILGLLALLGLGLTGHVSPEQLRALALKALGL